MSARPTKVELAPKQHQLSRTIGGRALEKTVLFGTEFHITDPFSDGMVVLAGQWSEKDRAALLLVLQGLHDLGVWPPRKLVVQDYSHLVFESDEEKQAWDEDQKRELLAAIQREEKADG